MNIFIHVFMIFIDNAYFRDICNSGKHSILYMKNIALGTSLLNLIISFIVFIFFNLSSNNFQFVQEHYNIQYYDIYLGVDGISIYFVLLTTIIMPIALTAN
jgi:NADH-ubiquinone oxidoreductase chain 4